MPKTPSQTEWTPERDDFLVEGYLAGRVFEEMAEDLGCTEAAARARVRNLRKTRDIPQRKDIHRPAKPHVRCDFRVIPKKGLPFTEGGDEAVALPRIEGLRAQGCQIERIL